MSERAQKVCRWCGDPWTLRHAVRNKSLLLIGGTIVLLFDVIPFYVKAFMERNAP